MSVRFDRPFGFIAVHRPTGFRRDTRAAMQQVGTWTACPEGLMSMGTPGDRLVARVRCDAVRIAFLCHSWSGSVQVVVDDVFEMNTRDARVRE